jgi:hypothetical protein
LVIYLKGLEQFHKARQRGIYLQVDSTWTRVEVRIKPKTVSAQVEASQMTPDAFLSSSRWMARFMSEMGQETLTEYRPGSIWNPKGSGVAIAHMASQYASHIIAFHEAQGFSNEELGSYLLRLAHEASEARGEAPSNIRDYYPTLGDSL